MPADLCDVLPFTGYAGVHFPTLFVFGLISSTLIDGYLVHRVLFHHAPGSGPPPLNLSRVIRAIMLLVVFLPLKALPLLTIGVGLFGLMSVVWYDLVLVLPYCALRALWRSRKGASVSLSVKALAVLALCALPLCYYMRWVEPYDLRLEAVDIDLKPERSDGPPLRISVLADLQTDQVGEYEQEAIDRLLACRPDIILVPGDLFHGSTNLFEKKLEALRQLLSRLTAPGGVYFARGDVDPRHRVGPMLEGTGIIELENEIVRLEVRGRAVTLGGVDRDCDSAAARAVIQRLQDEPGGDDIRILMAHRPDVIRLLKGNSRIDLTVSGHTHGGQVVLPGFGPLLTLSDLPRKVAAGGLHELNGNRLYLSRGVGQERGQAPRIRLLAPPEISLLTLKGGLED
ncbi:MAG: metallophosphoesterase [Planctomycetota bacterium]